MSTATKPKTLKITVEHEVDADDVRHILTALQDGEFLNRTYGIGYWAYGINALSPKDNATNVWLVVEQEDREVGAMAETAIVNRFRRDPSARSFKIAGFKVYVLDEVAAMEVVKAHLALKGNLEYDLPSLDQAIQKALLNEQRYG